MAPTGIEVIIGGQKDADFGDILIFGTGGVNTEEYADVAFSINPLSKDEIIDLISSTTIGKILKDRKRTDEMISIVANIACLLRNHQEIKDLNINPLIISEKATQVVDIKIRI
jgi:acetyltransferase